MLTIVVDSLLDVIDEHDSFTTLREAITEADQNPGHDTNDPRSPAGRG